MEHQSTGEEKQKISRSKARHLRRKRLAAARRATGISSDQSEHNNTEENSSPQKSRDILSKSKARRLRKKKIVEKVQSDSDNQTEFFISSQSPTNFSEYDKSDRSLYDLQFDAVDISDSFNLPSSLTEAKAADGNSDKNRENDSSSNYQKNSGKIHHQRDSASSDDSQILEASSSKRDYQIQNTKTRGKSNDVNPKSGTKFDQNIQTLLKTELHKTFLKHEICSDLIDSHEPSESQVLICGQNRDFETIGSSDISNFQFNQSNKNNEVIQEKENRLESALRGLDIGSSNFIKNTTDCSLQTDTISDDDLGSPSSNSSSNLIDQYEVNAIQAQESSGFITRTTKTVLNTTELIENEKNLKISGSSLNSHSVFQPNAAVIDLSTYSSSDFIINTESTSRSIEEQQIIIDFISDSSTDFIQNNEIFYTHSPEITGPESQSTNTIHEQQITENQTSYELIKDYSLPSTSVRDSVLPGLKDPESSVERKTLKDLDGSCIFKESEIKMSSVEKTREQIKAEREAKKAAKALAKSKGKTPKSEDKPVAKSSSKDASAKAENSEQAQTLDTKKTVVVKKQVEPAREKIIKPDTESVQSIENKENESQSIGDGKSKRESRAERRAKQEAQRAAKDKLAAEKNKPKSTAPIKSQLSPKTAEPVKMVVRKTLVDNNLHEVKLFKHLYHARELSLVNSPILNSNIHPAIVRLGVQYASKVIVGSNARCVALLAAVKELVEDFERPSQADFTRGLEASLQECAAYLHHCRPMAVSMQNALKHLKWQMTQLPATVSDQEAKSKLGDAIDTYIREQILLAGKAISNTIQTKISNGDVILTYAFSSLIHNILIDAHIAGKQFRVIVVDGRPWLEGREQLRRLAKHGIECSYILINALSFIMPEVTKVFLGAHAILANGAVMSRAGTAQVALMAKAFNVPVLVACETHKSCERVQTDSFVYNEIGDADELAQDLFSNLKKSLLSNWKTKKSLDLLNITFDVTPADLVSAVVTELAILPCTSIPVILRIKPSEI